MTKVTEIIRAPDDLPRLLDKAYAEMDRGDREKAMRYIDLARACAPAGVVVKKTMTKFRVLANEHQAVAYIVEGNDKHEALSRYYAGIWLEKESTDDLDTTLCGVEPVNEE